MKANILPLFLGDVVALFGGLVLALGLRHGNMPSEELVMRHLDVFAPIFVLWFLVFLIAGMYDRRLIFARKRVPALVLKVQIINILLAALFLFLFPADIAPKTVLALYLIMSTMLMTLWRLFVFPLVLRRRSVKAVVVGSGEEARSVAAALSDAPIFHFLEVRLVDPGAFDNHSDFADHLLAHVEQEGVSVVIGDTADAAVLAPLYYNMAFLHGGRQVEFFSIRKIYEELFHRLPPSVVREEWLLENVSSAPHLAYDAAKRLFDAAAAAVLCVLSLILYPFIIAAIKLEDGGPVFYRTERVGRYNRPIRIIKFRSMTGRDEGAAALQTPNRVTRVGRILRQSRLDELPQLWNVLRGDLSFIGPRPEMPALASVYAERIPHYNMRHLIQPGLSGWAQLYGRHGHGEVALDETVDKLSYDLYYLKHRSFFLDIEIMLKTIRILLARSGT